MVDSNFFSDSCRDALQELLLIFALRHGFVYGISDYASNTVFLPFPSLLLSLPFSMESRTQRVARSDKVQPW